MKDERRRLERYKKRFHWLKDNARTWISHCREIQENATPTLGRFLSNEAEQYNDGRKRYSAVHNNSPKFAVGVLAAGIHNNLTSPVKPWYRCTLDQPDLIERDGVREWLEDYTNSGIVALQKSNFYEETFKAYEEISAFGTTAMLAERMGWSRIRYTALTFGEYYLAMDEYYEVDTLYRRVRMTTKDMLRRFPRDRVSPQVLNAAAQERWDDMWPVVHVIEPRELDEYDDEDDWAKTPRSMAWKSVYFEEAASERILGEKGYESKPFAAARWRANPGDTYGFSPVMDGLGDIKVLQYLELIAAQGLSRQVDPPLNAPASMRKAGAISTRSGDVNWYDGINADTVKPTLAINPDMSAIDRYKEAVETRIRRHLYNELFMAITDIDRQMTATEVRARQIEKLTILGPVVQQLQQTLLSPLLYRTYDILHKAHELPIAPYSIQDLEWKVEYTGMLAQAQKAVDTVGIDSLVAYVTTLANVQAAAGSIDLLDKVDMDQVIDEVADMVGTPARIVRSDEEVDRIRAAREQQQAMQRQMQAAAEMAPAAQAGAAAAKDLSETKLSPDKDSALNMMLGLAGGAY